MDIHGYPCGEIMVVNYAISEEMLIKSKNPGYLGRSGWEALSLGYYIVRNDLTWSVS